MTIPTCLWSISFVFLTEEDVLRQVVNQLSSQDVIGQLSVQLLLLLLLPLKQLSIRSARIKTRYVNMQLKNSLTEPARVLSNKMQVYFTKETAEEEQTWMLI